jgi:hypothetical protein
MLGFTLAPAAPIPALPPAPPKKSLSQKIGGWAMGKAGDGLILILIKAPAAAVFIAFACAYWLTNQTIRGRFRHHLRPFWVACLAWYPAWWTPLAWLGAAVALYLFPRALYLFPAGDRISPREQAGLADAACLLAAWEVLAPGLEPQVRAVLFLEFTAAGLSPWWLSRAWRSEPEVPDLPHPLVEAWQWQVAEHPKAGPLAATVLWHDPTTDRFHLRAPIDGDDGVENASDRACRLMCRPRGTVTISPDPDGDANDFLVALTDRGDPAVVRYLAESDLDGIDQDGSFITADTADGRPAPGALRGPSGAAHVVILAPSRYGKGIVMRQYGVALARWEKAFLNVADCKGEDEGGAGVPELRHGADVYGWQRDQWRACVEMHHELFSARAGRYGRVGRNFYHPDAVVDGYADPLAALMIDEMRKMYKAWGKAVVTKLEDMASQGASFGVSLIVNTQKGDADSLGSTTLANDLRGNGTVYIGRYEHAQAARDALQGFDVDSQKLPNAKGWWFVKSAFYPVPLVPMRSRLLPTSDEVEFMGFDLPHGLAEDWLVQTKRAKLHPQDQEIVEKWRPWFEDAPAPVVPGPEPVMDVTEPAPGVHVEAPARILHAVPAQPLPDTTPALDLIPKIVREGGVMTRGEIAEAAGIKPEYASDRLKKLKEMGVMTEARTADGRPGWRVVE